LALQRRASPRSAAWASCRPPWRSASNPGTPFLALSRLPT